jgi:methylated-DNA-protein-cysteine methyltransferase-like protein
MKSTFEIIYEVVMKIPAGRVATYGQVAAMAGNPRWSQVVGFALHVNPRPGVIPCHRVVNRFGETSKAFAFGGEDVQRQMLEDEGVVFLPDGRVDMEKCAWRGE